MAGFSYVIFLFKSALYQAITLPLGMHEYVFWSIILAVYATADVGPEPFLTDKKKGLGWITCV